MRRLLKALSLPLIIIFGIALVIIAIPFAVVASIVDIPFRKKRQAELREAIAKRWLPARKFIYISYDTRFFLADYVDSVLLPKYGKHVIVDKWSDGENKWSNNFPDDENRVTSIASDVLGDYDGSPILMLTTLSKSTEFFESGKALNFFGVDAEMLELNGKPIKPAAAKEAIEKKIKECIEEWGSKE